MTAKSNKEKMRIRRKQAKEAQKIRQIKEPDKPVKVLDRSGNIIQIINP